MTTVVRVMVSGNKECEVRLVRPDGKEIPTVRVKPQMFTDVTIYGDQKLEVCEIGEPLENTG